MEALHLPLVAAEAWDKIAALGEPGWSDEARRRGAALREAYEAHRKEWQRVLDATKGLVIAGELPPPELVRAHPSNFRGALYDAMNASPTEARLDALRPIALVLENDDPNAPLLRHFDRLRAAGVAKRRPFLDRYVALFRDGPVGDVAAYPKLANELRKAGQDELFVGVVDRSYLWREYNADLARIAKEHADPWTRLLAERGKAKEQEALGHYDDAERTFRAAVAECDSLRYGALCARLEFQRVMDLFRAYRIREAERAAVSAFARAEADFEPRALHAPEPPGEERSEARGLPARAGLRVRRDASRAYVRERPVRRLRDLGGGVPRRARSGRRDARARPGAANRRVVRARPREDARRPRAHGPAAPGDRRARVGDVRRAPVALRGAAPLHGRGLREPAPRIRARARRGDASRDHRAGACARVELGRQGRDRLESSSLGWEAAKRGEGERVTDLFAAESELDDTRCSLTIGVDYERHMAVARDEEGAYTTITEARAKHFPPARDELLPADLVAKLRRCPKVTVIASAPVHGSPGLLPPDLAWGYRIAAPHRSGGAPSLARSLVVSNVEAPAELSLPPLAGLRLAEGAMDARTTWLRGDQATAAHLLHELPSATEVQIHTHGLTDVGESDAPLLVLTPDASGKWAISANDVAGLHLDGHPVVVLAACHSAAPTSSLHEHWSLPAAFIRAGARSVIASSEAIPDEPASRFFESVLKRIRAGAQPAEALRDERVAFRGSPGGEWVDTILLFE